jgi:hypothetical protein
MLVDSHLLTLFSLSSPEGLDAPKHPTRWDASSLGFLAGIHGPKSQALKTIVQAEGWPLDEHYTDHAEAAAFMIVLHADYDLEFQTHCHGLMLEWLTRGKSKPGFLAFLTDRILCNKGLHQRFGTQIREAENGCFVPKSLESEIDTVDRLREEVQLGESMLDYYQRVNSGDLLLPRLLLGDYADIWEGKAGSNASNVIPFGKP